MVEHTEEQVATPRARAVLPRRELAAGVGADLLDHLRRAGGTAGRSSRRARRHPMYRQQNNRRLPTQILQQPGGRDRAEFTLLSYQVAINLDHVAAVVGHVQHKSAATRPPPADRTRPLQPPPVVQRPSATLLPRATVRRSGRAGRHVQHESTAAVMHLNDSA